VRRSLHALRSLERDLGRLEQRAEGGGDLSRHEQAALYVDALYDAHAAERLEALHAAGRIDPLLFRLYRLEQSSPIRRRSE